MDKRKNLRKRIFALIAVCLVFVLSFSAMAVVAYADYNLNWDVAISSIKDQDKNPVTLDQSKDNKITVTATYGTTTATSEAKLVNTTSASGSFQNLPDEGAKEVQLSITDVVINGGKGEAKGNTSLTYKYSPSANSVTFSGIDFTTGSFSPTVKYASGKSTSEIDKSEYKVVVSGMDNDMATAIFMHCYNNNQSFKDFVVKNIGKTFNMVLLVKDDVDSSDKDKIKDWIKNSSTRKDAISGDRFFDVSIWVYAGDVSDSNEKIQITDTGSKNKLEVTVTIKDSLKKTNRSFYLIKKHGDSVSCVEYGTSNKYTHKTNEFSTFNIAYYDGTSPTPTPTPTPSASSKSSLPSTGSGGSTTTSGKSPKTGDDFSFLKWLYFVLIGGTIIYSSVTLLKDTHDDVDE